MSELSAGEIDDNESFKEYLKYRADSSHLFSEAWYEQTPVNVDVSERYVITVKDSEGKTVHNATVTIDSSDGSWQGFSYADGRSLFMPLALRSDEFEGTLTLTAEKDGALGTTEVERTIPTGGEWEVVLDGAPDPLESIKLDVLYLLDATGSMADEIESIKSTLTSVASRISDIDAAVDLRMGMVAYRDRGDAYVTQVYEFDSDIPAFADRVAGVQADEGGDTPESVNEALHASLDSVEWRQDDTVRLVIMVADAGPHMDYQNDPGYDEAMATALRRGVKIHTIASSGLDEFGEYVFRQVAQHTMGKFVFIVYGENGDTPHSVGDQYTIQNLDDLVVNLVAAELDHLND